MTNSQYEHFTELLGYNNELEKIKKILQESKRQFGSKCQIGDRPNLFYIQLSKIIDEEIKSIESEKLKV